VPETQTGDIKRCTYSETLLSSAFNFNLSVLDAFAMSIDHKRFMQAALDMAQAALSRDEFPVGCIMVYRGKVIASGARRGTCQPIPSELDHAEIIALRELETLTEPIDRKSITVYTTMEPCLMCYGALLISGIENIVYAYEDAMGGATACDRSQLPALYKHSEVKIIAGVCRQESLALFKAYFSRAGMDYWKGSLLAEYTLAQQVP
jgi:tRNA(adenine34) deaminase